MVSPPAAWQALLDAHAWSIWVCPDVSGSAGALLEAHVGAVLIDRLVADYRTGALAQVVVHVEVVLVAAVVALREADAFAPRVPQVSLLTNAVGAHTQQRFPCGVRVAEMVLYTTWVRYLVAAAVHQLHVIWYIVRSMLHSLNSHQTEFVHNRSLVSASTSTAPRLAFFLVRIFFAASLPAFRVL